MNPFCLALYLKYKITRHTYLITLNLNLLVSLIAVSFDSLQLPQFPRFVLKLET